MTPHRAAYNATDGEQGLLISRVLKISPSYGQLQDKDVLLEFDGVPVAPDGTVPFRTGERIGFCELLLMGCLQPACGCLERLCAKEGGRGAGMG